MFHFVEEIFYRIFLKFIRDYTQIPYRIKKTTRNISINIIGHDGEKVIKEI